MPPSIRCLSAAESTVWLTDRGYTAPYDVSFSHRQRLRTPSDSGKKAALVKSIMTWLPTDGDCILLVTAWGVWPSSENVELFERVRASLGQEQRIHDAPGQVLSLAYRGALECMLDVCLYNYWDGLLADEKHRVMIRFSHDEFIDFCYVTELRDQADAALVSFRRKQ